MEKTLYFSIFNHIYILNWIPQIRNKKPCIVILHGDLKIM